MGNLTRQIVLSSFEVSFSSQWLSPSWQDMTSQNPDLSQKCCLEEAAPQLEEGRVEKCKRPCDGDCSPERADMFFFILNQLIFYTLF